MKVLQVLTLVAPGNPFGGPVSVAVNQVEELRRRGHDVELVASQPPARRRGSWTSSSVDAFTGWQVVPGAGFSGLASPGLYTHVRRRIRDYDVVHVHMSRDLVTMPVAALARRRGVPYVLQMHGMVDASSRRSAAVLDAMWTRRVVSGASRVLTLTDRERSDVATVVRGGAAAMEMLINGVRPPAGVVAIPEGPTRFVFCSRLHGRKRPVLFAEAAVEMLGSGVDAEVRIVGADEGELAAVRRAASAVPSIVIDDAVEPGLVGGVLDEAGVLVLPSVDEPFPMVVIEAMSRGRAVIVTESCGLAAFVRDHGCGCVIAPDDKQALVEAMSRLASDSAEVAAMGARGAAAVREYLGIAAVVDRLEAIYAEVAAGRPASSAMKST